MPETRRSAKSISSKKSSTGSGKVSRHTHSSKSSGSNIKHGRGSRMKVDKRHTKGRQKEAMELSDADSSASRDQSRFAQLSDRLKRAVSAERRLVVQCKEKGSSVPSSSSCRRCRVNITGRIPFEYKKEEFCSHKCAKEFQNVKHRKTKGKRR